jgi:hypothetical protein
MGHVMPSYARDPILKPVSIADLRPTQMSVGMREVKEKRKRLRERGINKIGDFLGDHMVPVVLGPDERHFVIDHHHLALALHRERIKKVLVTVVADLSEVAPEDFWHVLDQFNWVYAYDERGRRCDFSEIPNSIDKLKDDPFRSLAGELRRRGGFAKDTAPFSEFLWADFFRRRVKRKAIVKGFDAALKKAMALAKGSDARYLPGWCGPTDS